MSCANKSSELDVLLKLLCTKEENPLQLNKNNKIIFRTRDDVFEKFPDATPVAAVSAVREREHSAALVCIHNAAGAWARPGLYSHPDWHHRGQGGVGEVVRGSGIDAGGPERNGGACWATRTSQTVKNIMFLHVNIMDN